MDTVKDIVDSIESEIAELEGLYGTVGGFWDTDVYKRLKELVVRNTPSKPVTQFCQSCQKETTFMIVDPEEGLVCNACGFYPEFL